jgi:ATP-binding cassette subfamily C exporter for protease/lipase
MSILSPRAAREGGGKARSSPLFKVLLEMRPAWTAVFVFSAVINLLMLGPTVYMMQVSDRVMTSRNMTTLLVLSLLALLIFAVMGTLEWARSRVMVRLGVRI